MDPITDMLNKIRNAQAVLHETVDLSFSNLKYGIVKILEKETFVERVEKKGRGDLFLGRTTILRWKEAPGFFVCSQRPL